MLKYKESSAVMGQKLLMRFKRLMVLLATPILLASVCQCSQVLRWFHRTRNITSEPASPENLLTLGFTWEKPTSWISLPPTPMRLATFLVPAEDQDPKKAGDASIVVLSGDGGGWEPNVNRWREQLDLAPLPNNDIDDLTQQTRSPLGTIPWLEILDENPSGQGMLVALVRLPEKTVFIKLVAPAPTLTFQQQNFLSLCQSIH